VRPLLTGAALNPVLLFCIKFRDQHMGDPRPINSPFGPVPFGRLAGPVAATRAAVIEPRQAGSAPTSLKILHVLRAPVGGLFRHVVDVTAGQIERGHRVGLICDSGTGGARAEAMLAELAPRLALGVERVPIAREFNLRDIPALWRIARRIKMLKPDVLHGHGAKAAALARLSPTGPHAVRVYTPHGGSLHYFQSGMITSGFYRMLEWLLNRRTDLLLFESTYAADHFRSYVGPSRALPRIGRNGLSEIEFDTVAARPDATDCVFVGELASVKAIDVLIEAIAALKRSGRQVSATVVGEGSERAKLEALAERLDVAEQVRFVGHRPAREAFTLGRVLVIPSRAESLPYVALEAAAAAVPVIATNVGGIPEIFGPHASHLVPPDDVEALVGAIRTALDDPAQGKRVVQAVRQRVRSQFSITGMVESGLAAYRETIALRKLAQSE
jgi:glycosyltransferase involved in cell wall biosynthesis